MDTKLENEKMQEMRLLERYLSTLSPKDDFNYIKKVGSAAQGIVFKVTVRNPNKDIPFSDSSFAMKVCVQM